jgi:hypothetical protein
MIDLAYSSSPYSFTQRGDSGILLRKNNNGLAARPPQTKKNFQLKVRYLLEMDKMEAKIDPICQVPSNLLSTENNIGSTSDVFWDNFIDHGKYSRVFASDTHPRKKSTYDKLIKNLLDYRYCKSIWVSLKVNK